VMAGGGHYVIDPEAEPGEPNEIWPTITTDADGHGFGRIEVDHSARGDAQAIVIHDPGSGTRLLCADLTADDEGADVTFTGEFSSFAAAEAVDESAGGLAMLTRGAGGTTVTLSMVGLDPEAVYSSHVHAMPCAVMEADGHYLRDPEAEAGESNELWPPIVVEADGGALESTLEVEDHTARADAQSIVIHRDGAKVLCADLVRSWPALVTSGDAMELPGAADQGVDGLSGSATMMRKLEGTTTVMLEASGLAASTDYPAHVHNRPCSVADGGSHYQLDESLDANLEANEVWLNFTTDEAGEGSAEVMVTETLRPEARAVVIHGTDGVRLACFDLE